MASAIGTARRPTQGSCRPVVTTSTGWPATSIVRPGTWMLEVGLNDDMHDEVLAGADAAERAAGMVRGKPAGVSSSRCSLPRCAGDRDAVADLDRLGTR